MQNWGEIPLSFDDRGEMKEMIDNRVSSDVYRFEKRIRYAITNPLGELNSIFVHVI